MKSIAMKSIALPYWGQITSLVSKSNNKDSRSLFITRQQSPVLYILDNKGEQFSLSSSALPCAMQRLIKIAGSDSDNNDKDKDKIIMLGVDGHLYQTDWQAKKVIKTSALSLLEAVKALDNSSDNSQSNDYSQQLTYKSTHSQSASPDNKPESQSARSLIDPVAMTLLSDIADINAKADSKTNNPALVILYPKHIVIWQYQNSQAETSITIEPLLSHLAEDNSNNRATAMATSSDGNWLVIGDKLGFVNSYQLTTTSDSPLSLSSRKQIHQGAVNALCFEPVSQHFFSAGADKNLYRTHVQGDLHPIDRAKASQHSEMITALCVSDTRLFSAADDKSIKSWSFDKGAPNTYKEELTKTRLLVLSSYAEQPALIAVGQDQSLRFIPIETAQSDGQNEKLQPVAYIIKDGYQRVSELLKDSSNDSAAAFKEGLALLNSQADPKTLDIVNQLLTAKSGSITANQALQLVAWVATTRLDKTTKVLEQLLNSTISPQVRVKAFDALAEQAKNSARPLQYLERALESNYEEVVATALQGYLQVALNDASSMRRIITILQNALSHKLLRIRKQALAALETLLPDDSPKADLLALDTRYPDVIQAGLIRLYQRDMLSSLEVSRQLMLLKNHDNSDVRQTAFYVSVLSQPELATALKYNASQQGDTQLLRTLTDFDDFKLLRGTLLSDELEATTTNNKEVESEQAINLTLSTQDFVAQADTVTDSKSKTTKVKAKPIVAALSNPLNNEALEPLLQSLANPHEDISFRAAYALACLQDNRAFGTLIRLMHTDGNDNTTSNDAVIRAGVARALGTLAMEDGKAVLPVLLDDKDAGVRLVAMKAFGKLADSKLAWAAVGFGSQHQDIHEQALAIFLTQVLADKPSSDAAELSSEMNAILLQALNNPFTSIRLEVVKVLLNREGARTAGLTITNTIELLQQSLFEDVHQVAVEEWQRNLLNSKSKTKALANLESVDKANSTQTVLALFFADNFATIRQQTFDIALKNTKHFSFNEIITTALASPYLDIKKLALSTAQAKASIHQLEQLFPALISMLADESIELRAQALKVALALSDLQPISLAMPVPVSFSVTADDDSSTINNSDINDTVINNDNSNDNNEALITAALASPYPDIQLKVAQLLAGQSRQFINNAQNTSTQTEANHTDEQAYAVFKHYLTIDMPTQNKDSDEYKQWHQHISQALGGLAKLAHPAQYNALEWYSKYLNHPDANFQMLAPNLMFVVAKDDSIRLNTDDIDTLVKWQKDERALISQSASLALAVWGDADGEHFFNKASTLKNSTLKNSTFENLATPLTPTHWLQAKQGLGITHARQLRHVFDSKSYAPAARLLLIFNDIQQSISDNGNTNADDNANAIERPQRLIEALSFADNETAVVYANILARYPAHYSIPSPDDVSASVNKYNSSELESSFFAVWQYLSDYLSRKVGLILSAHSSVLDSLAHGVKNNAKNNIKNNNKNSNDTIRTTILNSVSAPILRQLAASLSTNQSSTTHLSNKQPLLQAQAISVIAHLSILLSHDNFESFDNDNEVLATLQAWQRSLQALLSVNDVVSQDTDYDSANSADVKHNSPYQNLAFGAWLGVIREGDDYYSNNHTTNQAIRGLMWLTSQANDDIDSIDKSTNAINSADWSDSVSRVLLPLLNHNNFDTRKLAWDCLYELEVSAKKLCEYAMSTSYPDMVKQGLQLLLTSIEADNDDASDANSPSNQQLITLLKTNNQSLAEETYALLKQRLGLLPASLAALDSYCDSLRYQVVGEWQQVVVKPSAQLFEQPSEPAANTLRSDKLTFLLQAIDTDGWQIRYRAFVQLVNFYEVLFADNRLFDALFEFWRDSQSRYDENQAFSLILNALRLYQRVNTLDNNDDKNNNDDKSALTAKLIVDNTYSKLLGLLDYPQLKMPKLEIYQGIASLRDTDIVAELLQRLRQSFEHNANDKSERQQIFDTLVTISGYDQPIEDYLDESADKRWLQRQYPRHPQVLLALFSTLMSYADYEHAAQLLPSLSWAKATKSIDTEETTTISQGKSSIDAEIDEQLALAYEQLPAKHIFKLVQTLAYRAERREASLATLQKALVNKDADVQFLAAEGLAKCGQPQGLTILMATIDYNSDGELRRRSVLAIGELMGSRNQGDSVNKATNNNEIHSLYKAYDKLITLAEDNEHYLQDVASEALGRLAQSGDFEYSNHIFELLKSRLSDPNLDAYNPAVEHWLNGLRWLNTLGAWEQIRHYIRQHLRENDYFIPEHAITLLPFNDSDANKALLLELLQRDDDALNVAYPAAQKLWGNETDIVYPYDWAILQNNDEYFLEEIEYLSLNRIVNNATIEELTAFISQYSEQLLSDVLIALQNAIMTRDDMSKLQLIALIESSNGRAQHIGLRYLAQYPNDYLDKDLFASLQQRFDSTKQEWQVLIDTITRSPIKASDESWLASIEQVATTIEQLLWLICRYLPVNTDKTNLKKMIDTINWLNTMRQLPIMNTILPLATAVSGWWQQALLALLARPVSDDSLLLDLSAILKPIAAAHIHQLTYANQTLLTTLIARLEHVDEPLITANKGDASGAISAHQQLLLWLKAKDAAALYDCAINENTDTSVRVRAIEALGQMHEPQIGQWLESLMNDLDEDIQKLAYKVLRRWQRAMIRAQQKRPSAFASMDVINSPVVKAISTQEAGDNK